MLKLALLSLITFINLQLVASSTKPDTKGPNKAEILRNKALASANYTIELTAQDYKFFIEEGPRPYDMVVLFLADNNEICN
jgi:hypothetical protein